MSAPAGPAFGSSSPSTESKLEVRRWQPRVIKTADDATAEVTEPNESAARFRKSRLLIDECEFAKALAFAAADARERALAEEQESSHRAIERTLARLRAEIEGSIGHHDKTIGQAAVELVSIFTHGLATLRPELDRQLLEHAIDALVHDNLKLLAGLTSMQICVAPDQVEAIDARLKASLKGAALNLQLTMIGDTEQAPGNASIVWHRGRAEIRKSALLDSMVELLGRWCLGEKGTEDGPGRNPSSVNEDDDDTASVET